MPKRTPIQKSTRPKTKRATNTASLKKSAKAKKVAPVQSAERLYTLAVYIIGGPVTKEFAGKVISRTIQIKGSQTLEQLHQAIFAAFDRWEEHLYEFSFGKGPYDRSKVYSLRSTAFADFDIGEATQGDVKTTTIDDLGLKVGRAFGYAFDFGDDWQHQINVETIAPAPVKGKFPKIINCLGASPPQYPELDEDEEEWDDEE